MAVQIRLQPYQLADLAALAQLGPDQLDGVISRLRGEKPVTSSQLRKIVASVLSGDDSSADQLLRLVLSLNSLIRQRELELTDVLEGLDEGIRSASEPWDDELLQKWHSIRPLLPTLFGAEAVRIVSKATDLAYDYANLFQGARIITDIRPVYNEDATAIDAAVVSYTLRLHYDNRGNDHSLSIALDEADVKLLREQCDRAIEKSRLAKSLTSTVPTFISGSDDDAT